MTSITPESMVELLNEAYTADRQAVNALIHQHVQCDIALDGTPTVTSSSGADGQKELGLLGILNGFLVKAGDTRRIAALLRLNGDIEGFCLTKSSGILKIT